MKISYLPKQITVALLASKKIVTQSRQWMLFTSIAMVSTAFILPLCAQDDVVDGAVEKLLRAMEKKGAAAIKPIHIPADALNHTHVTKAQQKWAERVWINPALTRIEKLTDAPWKSDTEKFLRAAPAVIFTEQLASPPVELAQSGRKLVTAGCNDPAVLIFSAILDRWVQTDWRYVEKCVSTAMQSMEKDPEFKAVHTFYASQLSIWANKLGGFQKPQKASSDKFQKAAFEMAEDGSYLPDEAHLYIRHYLNFESLSGMPEKMIQVAMKLPIPEWTQKTLIGVSYKTIAWNSRGSGYAYTVKEEGWKGFSENLEKARTALVDAWKLNPKFPFAASEMISIVMAGHGEKNDTLELWFERAIAAQCDYSDAYHAILWAYRPRWCGGHELMLAFGKACAATKRYDLDVPIYFTHACNNIVDEMSDSRKFYRRPDVAKVLIEVSEGLVRTPSRKAEQKMRLSYLAVNAWLAGDHKRAASALAELKGPLHADATKKLSKLRTDEVEFREDIAIAQSPFSADYKKAIQLYENQNLAEAETILLRIKATASSEIQGRIQEMLGIIAIEKKLANDEWVTLPVDPSLRGWIKRSGKWSGTADGKLVNHGNDSKGFIMHRARVGPDFEMRLEYSVEAQKKCCQHCQIVFGSYEGFEDPFNVAHHGKSGTAAATAWISGKRYNDDPIKKVSSPYLEKNQMLLHSKDEKLTFTVNGKEVIRDFTQDNIDFGTASANVGIGSYRWCRMNVTDISKIEVRRLAK